MDRERLIDYVLGRLTEQDALEIKALAENDAAIAQTLQTLREQLRHCAQYDRDNIALAQALRRELALPERSTQESQDVSASKQAALTESDVSLYPLESLLSDQGDQAPQSGSPDSQVVSSNVSETQEITPEPQDNQAIAVNPWDSHAPSTPRGENQDAVAPQGDVALDRDLPADPTVSALGSDAPGVAPKPRRSRRFAFIPKRVSAPSRRDHEQLIYKRAMSVEDREKNAAKLRKFKRTHIENVDVLGLGEGYWSGDYAYSATDDSALLFSEALVGEFPEYDSTQYDVQCDVNAYRIDDVELSTAPYDENPWQASVRRGNFDAEEASAWALLRDYFEETFQTDDALETTVDADPTGATLYLPYGQTERFWSERGEPNASYALNPYRFTLAQTKSIFETTAIPSVAKPQDLNRRALHWGAHSDVYRRHCSQVCVDPDELIDAFDSTLANAWNDSVAAERSQNRHISEVVAPWITDESLTLRESVEMTDTQEVSAQTSLEQLLEKVERYSVVDAPYTFDVTERVSSPPVFALRPLDEPTFIPGAWSSLFAQDAPEPPVVDESQALDESPVVEEPQIVEELPVTEALPIAEEQLVAEASTVVDEPTIAEEQLVAEATPVIDEPTIAEEQLIAEATPVVDEPTIAKEQLVAEATPVIDEPTITEEQLIAEATPVVVEQAIVATSVPEEPSLTEATSVSVDDATAYEPVLEQTPDYADAPRLAQTQTDDVMGDIAAYFGLDGVIIPQELATFISVDRDDEDEEEFGETLSAEDQRLAELLGRRPTLFDHDEYYWEEEKTISTQARAQRSRQLGPIGRMVKFVFDLITLPPVLVGRVVIAGYRSIFGADVPQTRSADARRRGRNAQAPARLSDMFISTAVGILIAVCVVFPALRYAVQEVVTVIAASKVRRIGESVPISPNHSEADLLPLISEHMLYPHYEAVEISGDGTGASYDNLESDGYPVIIE